MAPPAPVIDGAPTADAVIATDSAQAQSEGAAPPTPDFATARAYADRAVEDELQRVARLESLLRASADLPELRDLLRARPLLLNPSLYRPLARLELRDWAVRRLRERPCPPSAEEFGLDCRRPTDVPHADPAPPTEPEHAPLCADARCSRIDPEELLKRLPARHRWPFDPAASSAQASPCLAALSRRFDESWDSIVRAQFPRIRKAMAEADAQERATPRFVNCRDEPGLSGWPHCARLRDRWSEEARVAAGKVELERTRDEAIAALGPLDSTVAGLPECAEAAALLRSDPPDELGPSLAYHAASATLQFAWRELQDVLPRDYVVLELVDPVTGHLWGALQDQGEMGHDPYRDSAASDLLADLDCPGRRDDVAASLAAGSILHAVIPASTHCSGCRCEEWTTHLLAMTIRSDDGATPAVLLLRAAIRATKDPTARAPSGYWLAGSDDDTVLVDARGPRPAPPGAPLSAVIHVATYADAGADPASAPPDVSAAVRLEFDGVSLPGWLRAAHAAAEPVAPGDPLRCGTLRFFAPARPLP
ncbi:MAG: hypothetical protein HY905_24565 [Deltaproteobacteria bacterium]|nr:hypothetical protein [Deltaproteobacteria bacterium]